MLLDLNYRKKNVVLIVFMLFMSFIAWSFSYKKTFATIQLNRTLKCEKSASNTHGGSFPQIKRKSDFYKKVLKGYHVRKDERESRLWQAISGIAINQGVEISFNPPSTMVSDTVLSKLGLVRQDFNFKGKYFQLVKLVDSISRMAGIGKVSTLKLTSGKEIADKSSSDKLMLQITLSGIER